MRIYDVANGNGNANGSGTLFLHNNLYLPFRWALFVGVDSNTDNEGYIQSMENNAFSAAT